MLLARRGARVEPGDLVVAAFPDRPDIGPVVKRAIRPSGGGPGGNRWWIEGDNEFVDSDSRSYGTAIVQARVLVRYWPAPCLFRRRG
jgi:hypothetical protein